MSMEESLNQLIELNEKLDRQLWTIRGIQIKRQEALRCRYRHDLELICFEGRCDKNDCPIFEKESGKPAH